MWQAPDGSWRPLTFGLDDGWPAPPLWTGDGNGSAEDGRSGHAPAGGPGEPPRERSEPPRERSDPPGEDSDPLPPPQEPEDGGL